MAGSSTSDERAAADPRELLLLASVFSIAAAGLVYELVAGTLSTYLLGASVISFSVVIGLFLSAMGLGAFLAKYIERELVRAFVIAEIVLGLLGGLSALGLFGAFAVFGDGYPIALGLVCVTVGALVGVEIPLLLRILEGRLTTRVAVSHVLALDYVGALAGSLLFPLLLLPHLGAVRSSALFGLINLAVAGIALRAFGEVRRRGTLQVGALAAAALLTAVLIGGGRATSWLEDRLYDDPVIFAATTPYQRLVLTRWRGDTRLFVNGHLQFSTRDEHRYHEALVWPALGAVDAPARVLILGGGDGLAARQALRHPEVQAITVVDLDPEVTALFQENTALVDLNDGALNDPRVDVVNADAVRFLAEASERWDVILMDLPDPDDDGLSRLYSLGTFTLARRRLDEGGALATQATSPWHAPEAFWCILRTMESALASSAASIGDAAWTVQPYRVHVPSFGLWGFAIATPEGVDPQALPVPEGAQFLNRAAMAGMFAMPADLAPREVEINRLESGVLARYYRKGWGRAKR